MIEKARRFRPNRVLFIALIGIMFALALGNSWFSLPGTHAQRQLPTREGAKLDARVVEQIQSLSEEKRSRTPAQRKIDSQLLYAAKMKRGIAITREVPSLETDVKFDESNRTTVQIVANGGADLIEKLHDLGVQVSSNGFGMRSIRASASADQIEAIAALPEVLRVGTRPVAITSRMLREAGSRDYATDIQPSTSNRAERIDRVQKYLSSVVPRLAGAAAQNTNPIAIEADAAHRITQARNQFGFNGTGIKIGVISDGVSNLKISQTRDALGNVKVLSGQTGDGDEGTAMLELIHSLAPGAELYFATADPDPAAFAQNIRELRHVGCDIIVDDIKYLNEAVFQDGQAPGVISPLDCGIIAQAVNDVTRDGALYFSSAGNEGNVAKTTAGVWEGAFLDGGAAPGILTGAGRIHNFGNGQLTNQIITSAPFGVSLQWSDPLGKSANDYDMYVLNSTANSILAASTAFQDGTQDPFEFVAGQAAGRRVVITLFAGQRRLLNLNTVRGRLAIATGGQVFGHSNSLEAFSVAAAPAGAPFGPPPNPVGPFPGSFTSTNQVERFTSDGPRRMILREDGTPFVAGDFITGIVRTKPDITAADGTTVSGTGFFPTPFYGTSAAAPTAAAIAALLKSARPSLTNAQIRQALVSTAIDIEAPGVDATSGAGIVMPINAANALGFSPMADLGITSIVLTEASGNGNGKVEPGEGGRIQLQLKNFGVVPATNVNAVVESTTAGVLVTQPVPLAFGNIAPGATATASSPIEFTMSTVSACDLESLFSLELSYGGGPSPKTLEFEAPTGSPPIEITSSLDATAPTPGARFTTATGQQSGRITRTGIPTTCAERVPATLFATGNRRYDSYTFETCPTRAQTCVTIRVSSPCGGSTPLFAVAYADSFDPLNITQNYLGDSGSSGDVGQQVFFSVNVPLGKRLVVVIHEVDTGAATNCSYNLSVSGLCESCDSSNLVCIQDDDNGNSLLVNSLTGDYVFTNCANGATYSGRGQISKASGLVFVNDGRRLSAQFDFLPTGKTARGTGAFRPPGAGSVLSITDRNIFDSTCGCR